MEKKPIVIQGGRHTDQRGTISFVNDFDMAPVKRFYIIENANIEIKRGWRAHRIEQRWFNVSDGEFLVRLVKIDNWETPDPRLPLDEFLLSAKSNEVLHVPPGYASCLQATQNNSKLIVFADYGVEHATLDDYLYPDNYFEH